MILSDDIFSSAVGPDDSAFNDTRPVVDPNRNYLEDLVGDGKKFKTVEDLARGKAESDAFIASLLREKKEALEELNKRQTVEDLLAKMEQTRGSGSVTQQTNHNAATYNAGSNSENSQLNLDEIKAAVKADLEREQKEKAQQANLAQVAEKLRASYGDEANAVLARKAQELGVTTDYLRDIAKTSPKLFFATVGEAGTPRGNDVFTPPASRVNTSGLQNAPQYGQHKPMSYYQKLKATDPKTYFNPKTAVQMHKDALALGDAFIDT